MAMPAPDMTGPDPAGPDLTGPGASAAARDAIDAFLRHLADRGLSATTRRIRKTYLDEYLRHAQQGGQDPEDPGRGGRSPRAS